MFAGFQDNIPSMSTSYGFELFLYNQSEDHNFPVSFENQQMSTNTQLSIGIDRSFINKKPSPYSECVFDMTDLGTEWSKISEFLAMSIQSKTTYRQKNCFQNCYKNIVLNTCGCIIGHLSTAFSYSKRRIELNTLIIYF